MAKFENTQKINYITMNKVLHNFCPMGNDWYTNNLKIEIEPGRYIPDYVEIDQQLNELEGQSLIIEDVVSRVAEIVKEYEVTSYEIWSKVDDATHLSVEVHKYGFWGE